MKTKIKYKGEDIDRVTIELTEMEVKILRSAMLDFMDRTNGSEKYFWTANDVTESLQHICYNF
jgi:hypothetical protein